MPVGVRAHIAYFEPMCRTKFSKYTSAFSKNERSTDGTLDCQKGGTVIAKLMKVYLLAD